MKVLGEDLHRVPCTLSINNSRGHLLEGKASSLGDRSFYFQQNTSKMLHQVSSKRLALEPVQESSKKMELAAQSSKKLELGLQ